MEILNYDGFIVNILFIHIYQNLPYFKFLEWFFIYKNQYIGEKLPFLGFIFAVFFIKLLPNVSYFINSDDCIRKITSKSIWLYPGLFRKGFQFNLKMNLSRFIFCSFIFKILPKFSNFKHCDDCIGQITSQSIEIHPVYVFEK